MRETHRASIATGMAAVLVWFAAAVPVARDEPRLTGGVWDHVVTKGETLAIIGARAGVEVGALTADNGLPADGRLEIGQVLRIDNRHLVPNLDDAVIVINLPQRMLFFRDGEQLHAYPVAVGSASWRTPRGAFTISSKEVDPTWDVPASILEESRRLGRVQAPTVPPGPANPLGARWIGLSLPGIGIHGTTAPSSIFRAVSHGCIRLHPEDVARLFDRVRIGMPGRAIYEPVLLAEVDGRIYLEVHRDIYRALKSSVATVIRERAAVAGLSDHIDWTAVERVVANRHGVARDVTRSRLTQ